MLITTTSTDEDGLLNTIATAKPKIKAGPIAVMGISHARCFLVRVMAPRVRSPPSQQRGHNC
jgi:hypothetical protein